MHEWQPIETAPTDGTRVLVFGERLYRGGGTNDAEVHIVIAYRDVEEIGDEWLDGDVEVYPTHFMPLPAPPTVPQEPT